MEDENALVEGQMDAASTPTVFFVYDAAKAIAYAHKWANGRNSNYRSFPSDCANFASQCLHAGGVPVVGKPTVGVEMSKDIHQWYNTKSFYTQTFVQVAPLASFWALSKSIKIVTAKTYAAAVKEIKAGDVVNLIHPSTGVHYHSIFISKKSGSTVSYCGHTTDRKDEPLPKKDNYYYIMKFVKG